VKVLAFILSTLVTTGLALGGILLICGLTPDASAGAVILASAALSVLSYGPLLLGSLTAYFDVQTSSYSRRTFRLWLIIVGALEAAAGVCIVAYAVLAGAPAWVPILYIGAAGALTLIALGVGRWIFKRERARSSAEEPWSPVSPGDLRRMVFIVAITFVVSVVIAMVTLMVLGRSAEFSWVTTTLMLAVGFAFFAAAIACSLVTLKLQRRLRGLAGHDLGQTRKLTKVVLGRKPLPLGGDETIAATKFAVPLPTILGFQLAFILLLYVGLTLQQVSLIARGNLGTPYLVGFLLAMALMLAWIVPLQTRRIRRARLYVREHADLLPREIHAE
jgi:hypothetical protein